MTVWIVSMVLLVLTAVTIKPKDEQSKRWFFILAAINLVLLLGCRNGEANVGSDLNSYYRMYERAINMNWSMYKEAYPVEVGYLALNYALARVFPWPQFILFAQAAFCVGVYFYFIDKNTKNVNIATICFVSFGAYQFFLTGFRQSIAMCLGVLMFEVAKKKKIVAYLLLLIAATYIHRTAIVMLPIYLLVNMKNKLRNNFLVLVGSVVLVFFSRELLEFGMDVFDQEYGQSYSGNVLGGLVPILIYAITLMLCFVNKGSVKLRDSYPAMVRMLIVGAITYVMRYEATIMERISMYFTVVAVPLLAENIDRFKPGYDRRLVKLICLVCCVGLYAWRVATGQYTEYLFFWQ